VWHPSTSRAQQNSLQLCRKIDIFGTLRTALNDFSRIPEDQRIELASP
jgi:hypothetical protein